MAIMFVGNDIFLVGTTEFVFYIDNSIFESITEVHSMKKCAWFLFGLLALTTVVNSQEQRPHWITDGPFIDDRSTSFEVPLKVVATKVYVEVEIGGKPRRFVVDTGSPSMIDTALANEMGLEVVGKTKGRDSHGVVIESDIVQATVTLGGVEFYKVPMFCANFSKAEATKCFIGDGVLGSEMLPLGAWQIDLKNSVLRFNTDVKKLPFIDKATKIKLHSFGYPYAPILDVQFAKRAKSKAMFDTGSPAYFAISSADFIGAGKADGIGKTNGGFGSAGGSLGGQAQNKKQMQAELKTLSIGDLEIGRVGAIQRESSPSLIGARMLQHFVVTFDSKSGIAYFTAYADGPFARPSFGFTMAFDRKVSVALVWDNSPAHKAGLRAGQHLTSINGVATDLSSNGIRRAIESMAAQKIKLEWDGGSATLTRKSHLLQK